MTSIVHELYQYREMISNLVRKDLRGRYKGSFLGFLWTFINPLLQLAVYTMVFSVILRAGIDKYYLFLFVALIPWIFFANSLSGGAGLMIREKNLVTKIYFPREVLPVAFVTTNFVNMLYSFVIVLLAVWFLGDNLNILAWFCLPLIMAIEYLFSLGCTLLACAITVYLRDLEHILGIVTMAWQFLTPVMYSADMVPEELMPVFLLNPMTSIIVAYRDVLYYGRIPALETLLMPLFVSVIVLAAGEIVFRKLQRGFAEEL